jgi:hypothetical protein
MLVFIIADNIWKNGSGGKSGGRHHPNFVEYIKFQKNTFLVEEWQLF